MCKETCKKCPFRKENDQSGLLSFWNQIRQGVNPICQHEKPEHQCYGALHVVDKHLHYINKTEDLYQYVSDANRCNLTANGFWFWQAQTIPEINSEPLGLPWKDEVYGNN